MKTTVCVLLGLCIAVLNVRIGAAIGDICTYELLRGDRLYPREMLCSMDKQFVASFQSDGNFVVRSKASDDAVWQTGTSGEGLYLTLKDSGSLVMVDTQERRRGWIAGDVVDGERVLLHTDGSLLVYDSYGDVLWSSMAYEDHGAWCRSMLWENVMLHAGEALCSANLEFKASMTTEGDFVLYKMRPHRQVIWSTHTSGTDLRLMLQINGELTIRGSDGTLRWSTETSGPARYLVLQDDGNLVVTGRRAQIVWASNTAQVIH